MHETQEAVFFANGAIAATFGPGRYTLDSENYIFYAKEANSSRT